MEHLAKHMKMVPGVMVDVITLNSTRHFRSRDAQSYQGPTPLRGAS